MLLLLPDRRLPPLLPSSAGPLFCRPSLAPSHNEEDRLLPVVMKESVGLLLPVVAVGLARTLLAAARRGAEKMAEDQARLLPTRSVQKRKTDDNNMFPACFMVLALLMAKPLGAIKERPRRFQPKRTGPIRRSKRTLLDPRRSSWLVDPWPISVSPPSLKRAAVDYCCSVVLGVGGFWSRE